MNEVENKEMQVAEDSEKKSTSVAVNEFFKKASVIGKKVVDNVQEVAISTSQKMKEDSKERRKNKLRPLTLKEFKSKKFDTPNVIKIIDDADIRDIDVCEGAIGRLVTANGVEILYLCDKYIRESGLNFVPSPVCNAIYHVDNFDHQKYICTDEIFSKALEEKMAELEHIAFCLGAKSCSIEIIENNVEISNVDIDNSSNVKLKGNKNKKNSSDIRVNESVSVENGRQNKRSSSGKIVTTFSGNAAPKPPRLKWFEHNDNVKNLIEMRLSDGISICTKTLKLMGTSSASMTQKTAIAIDSEITKMGIKSKNSVEKQAQIEKNSQLIFEVIF